MQGAYEEFQCLRTSGNSQPFDDMSASAEPPFFLSFRRPQVPWKRTSKEYRRRLLNVKSLVIAIRADSSENHLPSLCVETRMFGVGGVLRDNVSRPSILQI